jgi:hypothetical protein
MACCWTRGCEYGIVEFGGLHAFGSKNIQQRPQTSDQRYICLFLFIANQSKWPCVITGPIEVELSCLRAILRSLFSLQSANKNKRLTVDLPTLCLTVCPHYYKKVSPHVSVEHRQTHVRALCTCRYMQATPAATTPSKPRAFAGGRTCLRVQL